jgi:hypothetical protein
VREKGRGGEKFMEREGGMETEIEKKNRGEKQKEGFWNKEAEKERERESERERGETDGENERERKRERKRERRRNRKRETEKERMIK